MVKRILFVCTANQCRSTMAHVIFEDMLSKEDAFSSGVIEVDSAGTNAGRSAAEPEAIEVMRELGLDLSQFRSKSIHNNMVDWADVVIVMDSGHHQTVVNHFPGSAGKTFLLSEYVNEKGDIPPPIFGGLEAYRECATTIQSYLLRMLDKLRNTINPLQPD